MSYRYPSFPHQPRTLDAIGPAWKKPAVTWAEAIERYVTFIQIPAWRARAPGKDGREPRECLPADEAAGLSAAMLRVANHLATYRASQLSELRPERSDLHELLRYSGPGVRKGERCSKRLHWHFQRALLLNEAGYACAYCRRTAWGVLSEDTGDQPRRTLRFEVDHETTRRRLKDRDVFEARNLVIACRSCNTIKAEMTKERFLIELKSLARAVVVDVK